MGVGTPKCLHLVEKQGGTTHPFGVSRPAFVAGFATFALYCVSVLTREGGASPLLTHWPFVVLVVLATLAVIARAILRPEIRLAWSILAVGLTLWSAGTIAHVLDVHHDDEGSASWPHLLWFALYPSAVLAFFAGRRALRRAPLSVGLDALMVMLVLSALVVAVLQPHVAGAPGDPAPTVAALHLGYTLGDALLISIGTAAWLVIGWRGGGMWPLFTVGAIALGVADALWALDANSGDWRPATAANAFYSLCPILVAVAAWRAPERTVELRGDRDVRIVVTAYVAAAVAIGLLLANEWQPVPEAAIVLAGLGLVAAAGRTTSAVTAGLRDWRTAARDRRLVEEVGAALDAGELVMHFQPLVDAHSGAAQGAEALLRWPRHGSFVALEEFLPAVERSRLIGRLTDFVIDFSLTELGCWRRAGHCIGVSVNLAAANLSDEDLPRRVAASLERHDVPADALTVEITERAAVDDSAVADRVLGALSSLGVGLAIDDFGTGHSSLSRIARFPLDELKIDRSFVKDIEHSDRPIVATTIDLAHTLGLRVVAEGVETVEMLNALREMDCDLAQGYYFSRPLPPQDVVPWLDAHECGGAGEPIRATLAGLVARLRMDAAFLAECVEGHDVIRAFEGAETFGPLREGAVLDFEASYCRQVASGLLPNVVGAAREDPRTRALERTRAAALGAYLSVPLYTDDGELYGAIVCVSHEARPDLGERAVDLVCRVAEQLRPHVGAAHRPLARRA